MKLLLTILERATTVLHGIAWFQTFQLHILRG